MFSDFQRSGLLEVSGFPASVNRNAIATAITNQFASLKVTAMQFVPNIARITFADAAGKQLILRSESIVVGDIPCRKRCGRPRPQKVFVYNFPFEANGPLARLLNMFGEVKSKILITAVGSIFRIKQHHKNNTDAISAPT